VLLRNQLPNSLEKISVKSVDDKNWVKMGRVRKVMQHIIFYAHVHAYCPSYTDEE